MGYLTYLPSGVLEEETVDLTTKEEIKISDPYPGSWARVQTFLIAFPSFYLDERRFSAIANLLPKKRFYCIFNWFRFFLYGVIPAIFLTICTILLILSLKRVALQLRHLSCKCKTDTLDSPLLTVNLIAILVFFLIGEVPGHLLSKKSAAVMLFGGDESATFEATFQTSRRVAAVLSAMNISINFLLYFAMHPPFRKGLRELICGAKTDTTNESKHTSETKLSSKEANKDLKIDIFVVPDEFQQRDQEKKFKIITKLVVWKRRWWNLFPAV